MRTFCPCGSNQLGQWVNSVGSVGERGMCLVRTFICEDMYSKMSSSHPPARRGRLLAPAPPRRRTRGREVAPHIVGNIFAGSASRLHARGGVLLTSDSLSVGNGTHNRKQGSLFERISTRLFRWRPRPSSARQLPGLATLREVIERAETEGDAPPVLTGSASNAQIKPRHHREIVYGTVVKSVASE